MEKINVAELLKDRPSGMKLDCTMYDNLHFDFVNADYYGTINCYTLIDGVKTSINFTKYGTFNNYPGAKCVIFPKGKTTWEGFVPPCQFKNGDIMVVENEWGVHIFIYNHTTDEYNSYGYYATLTSIGNFKINGLCSGRTYRLATEEEKQKLFDAIKANGYKWNTKTKTLEKLPKFKVGDRIRKEDNNSMVYTINGVYSSMYGVEERDFGISIEEQDEYELVPNKFDITTLKAFESKVLVRDINTHNWIGSFYSHYEPNGKKFYIIGGSYYLQCIPYKGNEHLLDTSNDCDEYYKTW